MNGTPNDLAARLGGIQGVHVALDVPAGPLCTYRVGGRLAVLATVESRAALRLVAAELAQWTAPTLVIGRGSNLLVADAGFEGVALQLEGEFASVEVDGDEVRAGAAVSLPVLARATVAAGLSGFEWGVGVPGSVGGAVRMNAGGHGSDMAATLVSAEIVDLREGTASARPAHTLQLGYRTSSLRPSDVVASATLRLAPGDEAEGTRLLSDIVAWRRENQPGGANAGSVFTNPPHDSAGRLIDSAGLKGLRVGSAVVSDKHANFIQSDPDGSADDIVALMVEIVTAVERASGVLLSAETRLVGFAEDLTSRVQHGTEVSDETGSCGRPTS